LNTSNVRAEAAGPSAAAISAQAKSARATRRNIERRWWRRDANVHATAGLVGQDSASTDAPVEPAVPQIRVTVALVALQVALDGVEQPAGEGWQLGPHPGHQDEASREPGRPGGVDYVDQAFVCHCADLACIAGIWRSDKAVGDALPMLTMPTRSGHRALPGSADRHSRSCRLGRLA